MVKILFCCHGNICRSPMAEFVMKDLVKRSGQSEQFIIASAATSAEELGNPVHPGTRNKLREYGIKTDGKYAVQLQKSDYNNYDYLIAMDTKNRKNMQRIVGADSEAKIMRLLDLTGNPRDIADPWYTGNFDRTYEDIKEGCDALLLHIMEEEVF